MTRLKQNWRGLAAYAAVMLVLTGLAVFGLLESDALFSSAVADAAGGILVLIWGAVLVLGPFAVLAEGGPKGWFKRYWKLLAYHGGFFPVAVLAPEAVSLIYVGIGGVWLAVYFIKYGKPGSAVNEDNSVYGVGAGNMSTLQYMYRFPKEYGFPGKH
ncbi:hypothetical protein [Ruegeria sp. HKCCD8929]|uniref:hypothetical protein n=1 Tax=Ruegeria sp. HKCCD8929 TaxID=2683006 RepID=UPI001487CD37|nr:hypothetical protein [Ruegeria sp. HKCCD8929]